MHNEYEQTSSGTGEVPYYAEETSKTVLRKFPRKSFVKITANGTLRCQDHAMSLLFRRSLSEIMAMNSLLVGFPLPLCIV